MFATPGEVIARKHGESAGGVRSANRLPTRADRWPPVVRFKPPRHRQPAVCADPRRIMLAHGWSHHPACFANNAC